MPNRYAIQAEFDHEPLYIVDSTQPDDTIVTIAGCTAEMDGEARRQLARTICGLLDYGRAMSPNNAGPDSSELIPDYLGTGFRQRRLLWVLLQELAPGSEREELRESMINLGHYIVDLASGGDYGLDCLLKGDT